MRESEREWEREREREREKCVRTVVGIKFFDKVFFYFDVRLVTVLLIVFSTYVCKYTHQIKIYCISTGQYQKITSTILSKNLPMNIQKHYKSSIMLIKSQKIL